LRFGRNSRPRLLPASTPEKHFLAVVVVVVVVV